MARELVRPNPTWQKWAEWLGDDPEPGTIYKDVIDMRAARRVWEGFQASTRGSRARSSAG